MVNLVRQPELQQRTLRLYGELLCRRENWARELVFAAYPGAAHCGIAAAASLVGAVSLVVDDDSAGMKAHFRDGAFDFVVNTLDEALRAIKNEIRKGTPLSIGLIADPQKVVAEAVERGLCAAFIVADVVAVTEGGIAGMAAHHAEVVDASQPSSRYLQWIAANQWIIAETPAMTAAEPVDDPVVELWLRRLSSHQRSVRGRTRWVWARESA